MNKTYLNWTTFFLCIILTTACEPSKDAMLIGTWKVESVIKLVDNQKAPDMNSSFEFREDGELINNGIILGELRGTWQVDDSRLFLIQGNDSTLVNISDLSNSELIWKTDLGEGELLFTLKKEESR
jgi:hypothetical protein